LSQIEKGKKTKDERVGVRDPGEGGGDRRGKRERGDYFSLN
jgi:hypothetical protein